jgi:hypothetical protein
MEVLDWWLNIVDIHTTRDYISQFFITHRLLFLVTLLGLPTADFPLLTGSRLYRVTTIPGQPHTVTAGFSRFFLQLLAPGLDWLSSVYLQLQLSILNWLPSRTNSQHKIDSLYTPRRGLYRKYRFQTYFIVACVHCLGMALVLLHVTQPLPSSGGFSDCLILSGLMSQCKLTQLVKISHI